MCLSNRYRCILVGSAATGMAQAAGRGQPEGAIACSPLSRLMSHDTGTCDLVRVATYRVCIILRMPRSHSRVHHDDSSMQPPANQHSVATTPATVPEPLLPSSTPAHPILPTPHPMPPGAPSSHSCPGSRSSCRSHGGSFRLHSAYRKAYNGPPGEGQAQRAHQQRVHRCVVALPSGAAGEAVDPVEEEQGGNGGASV